MSISSDTSQGAASIETPIILCAATVGFVADQASAQLCNPYMTGQTFQPATRGTDRSVVGVLSGQQRPAGTNATAGQRQTGGAGRNT